MSRIYAKIKSLKIQLGITANISKPGVGGVGKVLYIEFKMLTRIRTWPGNPGLLIFANRYAQLKAELILISN